MNIVKSIKALLVRSLGILPSRLPTGLAEFDKWADSIISSYPMPTADEESIKFVLATGIINLGSTVARKPKQYFANILNAAAAKQVASATFQNIKFAQAQRAAEATATQVVASNGTPQ